MPSGFLPAYNDGAAVTVSNKARFADVSSFLAASDRACELYSPFKKSWLVGQCRIPLIPAEGLAEAGASPPADSVRNATWRAACLSYWTPSVPCPTHMSMYTHLCTYTSPPPHGNNPCPWEHNLRSKTRWLFLLFQHVFIKCQALRNKEETRSLILM